MLVANESQERKSNPIEAGAYIARCVQIIDLGDQFNDMAQKYVRKTMLTFEIPSERVEVDGKSKPRLMSKTYTLSLNEKATLRKDLESWYGALDFPIDIRRVLGLPCTINVVSKKSKTGNEYSTIGSIGRPMKGIPVPEQETESLVFDIDQEDAIEAVEKLPEWIKKTIKESPSFKTVVNRKNEKDEAFTDINSDDLPF